MGERFLSSLAVVFFLAVLYILSAFVYPDVHSLTKGHPGKSAFMEYRQRQWDREGKTVRIHHVYVPLRRISPYLVKAVIIAEDDKFWHHEGFDVESMKRALETDIRERRFKAGGSTITQQLAKNLFLSPSKNPVRKIREAILAWRLERALSKRRIVELYLNYAEWGEGIFGIEAASMHYYGKHASDLSAREAASLAAVLPNPIRFRPDGTSRYVISRSNRIYRIMKARGIVIPEFVEVMSQPDEQGGLSDMSEETLEQTSSGLQPLGETEKEATAGDAGTGRGTMQAPDDATPLPAPSSPSDSAGSASTEKEALDAF